MKNRSAAAVEHALRAALAAPLEELREGIDMSAVAIDARILELCELSSLCIKLADVGAAAKQ